MEHTIRRKPNLAARKALVSFTAAIWILVFAEAVRAESLKIVLTNVHVSEGTIMLQVLRGEAEFNGEGEPIMSVLQRAETGEMSFTASALPKGEYAIRVMHDTNGNGKLDTNFVGIPSEPWAFSNNAVGNFGPPKWADVRFTLDGDVTQSITLNK